MKAEEFIIEKMPTGVDKLISLLIFIRNRATQLGAKPEISMSALETIH